MLEYLDALTILRVPGAECFIQRPLHFPNTAIPGLNFVCAAVTPDFYFCPEQDYESQVYEDVELLEVDSWARKPQSVQSSQRHLQAGMIIPRIRYQGRGDLAARYPEGHAYYIRLTSPVDYKDYVLKLLRTACGDENGYSRDELTDFLGWNHEYNPDLVFLALYILSREIDVERLPWSLPFNIDDLDRPHLKQHCRTLGLPVGGNKAALRTRILAHAFPTYLE